jgi:hypothetical protein
MIGREPIKEQVGQHAGGLAKAQVRAQSLVFSVSALAGRLVLADVFKRDSDLSFKALIQGAFAY